MKLARFTRLGKTALGKVIGDRIVDLSTVVPGDSMRALLSRLQELRVQIEATTEPSYPLTEVKVEAPIADPQKFLAIGMNYPAHAQEARDAGADVPETQLWFNKQVSCITGPADPVFFPSVETRLDYEGELGVVIGRRVRRISVEDAHSAIAGYLVVNDISARDWQSRAPTITLGKSFDSHGPIGPWIVTVDEITDPHELEMRLTVNGDERQRASTGEMIFNIFDQIAYLSTVMTLEPGDILATGTPHGVGAVTGRLLKIGDVVRVEISGIGAIENVIVSDK